MPKATKSTVRIDPTKKMPTGASAIKQGVSDDFKPRNFGKDSADLDAALDAAGIVDMDSSDESGGTASGKEPEAGAPPPVVNPAASGETEGAEAGTPPPVTDPKADLKGQAPVTDPKKGVLSDMKAGEKPPTEKAPPVANAGVAPDPKAVKPPVTDPKAGEKPKDHDPEIDGIEKPKELSEKNRDNWDRLGQTAKKYKTEAKEIRGKYEEAVGTINKLYQNANKVPEPVEKELTELRSFKKLFDIEHDPEFKKIYHEKISTNDKQIVDLLTGNGLPAEQAEEIRKKGFINYPLPWWQEHVFGPLEKGGTPAERESIAVIKNLLDRNHALNYDMKQEVKKAAEGQSEFWNQRETKIKEEQAADQQFVMSEVEKLQSEYPFLKEKPIPPTATPEEKQKLEHENQYTRFLHTKFAEHFKPNNVREKMATAVAATYAYIAEDQFISLQKQYTTEKAEWENKFQQLEAELNQIKQSSITSTAGANAGSINKADPVDRMKMKNVDAIDAGLAEAEASR